MWGQGAAILQSKALFMSYLMLHQVMENIQTSRAMWMAKVPVRGIEGRVTQRTEGFERNDPRVDLRVGERGLALGYAEVRILIVDQTRVRGGGATCMV